MRHLDSASALCFNHGPVGLSFTVLQLNVYFVQCALNLYQRLYFAIIKSFIYGHGIKIITQVSKS